jgi:nicotinamidase-related amidase
MPQRNSLRYGPLGPHSAHICSDMQRFFAEDTEWKRPRMRVIVPVVRKLVAATPERTFFTRFIPPRHPDHGRGAWRRYYERWSGVTMDNIAPELIELLPQLAEFVPPAAVIDKQVYSPWHWPALDIRLRGRSVDTVVVSGVRVLSTVLGAIDRGYRVIVATDALCSTSGESRNALLALLQSRYIEQVETAHSDVIVENWL